MRNLITSVILTFFLSTIVFSQGSKPVVLISGKALNERTMQPVDVDVRIVYETLPDGKEAGLARINPMNGKYKIILPYGKKYGYYALAEGYYSVNRNLDVTYLNEYTEIYEQNLFLAPLKVYQTSILTNIFFKRKSSELKDESDPELIRFYEFLKANKKIEVEISAHTDNKGNPADNKSISEQRAKAVVDFLIKKGIKESRLTYVGYGQTKPIGFNSDKEGRERNNRIEFKILSLEKTKK